MSTRPGDAEQTMRRVFEVPATRQFSATAWVTPFSQAPDDALDRLAGYRGPVTATSSSRVDGEPRWRASMALDGDPQTAWVADWSAGAPPWLSVTLGSAVRVTTLTLTPAVVPVRRPTPGAGAVARRVDAAPGRSRPPGA